MYVCISRYYQKKEQDDRKNSISYSAVSPLLADDMIEEEDQQSMKIKQEHESRHIQQQAITMTKVKTVLNNIKTPAFTVWLTFFITLSLYPSITVLIESSKKCHSDATRFNNDLFIPFLFFLFNLGDFCGRMSAERYQFGITATNMWIPAVCRFIFFPLFLLCNVSQSKLPVWFESDAWPVIFMILFAYSNGVIATIAMMYGPSLVNQRDMSLAGTMMVFFLTVGLGCGAGFSFVTLFISQGSIG
jgi:equilibrative nucleoside transporter 1/2/3